MKNLNLSHLKYFFDAAQAGSVGSAAAKNFVTSSTVSQGIRRLENSLGVSLLHHKKREFRLTGEGSRLLHDCDAIFRSIENLSTGLQGSEPSGPLRFASSHSLMSAFVLEAL